MLDAKRRISVTVPGSTSNLGPGFDCLGLALDLVLRVEVERASAGDQILITGSETDGISAVLEENLIWRTLHQVLEQAPGPLRMRIDNAIPVSRGLGSSAAARVAALALAELLRAKRGDRQDRTRFLQRIFASACRLEGHSDNAAPSVFGGFCSSLLSESGVRALPLTWHDGWQMLLVVPATQVETQAAREALPHSIPLSDAVYNVSRLPWLLQALSHGQEEALAEGMRDRLHVDQRLQRVSGLARALEMLRSEPGCIAASLSGSGPTLIAFYRQRPANAGEACAEWLNKRYAPVQRIAVAARQQGLTWQQSP